MAAAAASVVVETDATDSVKITIGARTLQRTAGEPLEKALGFLAVVLGAGNAAGGYVVTARMLEMFKPSAPKGAKDEPKEPQA